MTVDPNYLPDDWEQRLVDSIPPRARCVCKHINATHFEHYDNEGQPVTTDRCHVRDCECESFTQYVSRWGLLVSLVRRVNYLRYRNGRLRWRGRQARLEAQVERAMRDDA